MNRLSRDDAERLVTWARRNEKINWGMWEDFPCIDISGTLLQYDKNPIQFNLDDFIKVGNKRINCISINRNRWIVGKRWQKNAITFDELEELLIAGKIC